MNNDNFLVTMSGGTTTVINSTLVGIIRALRSLAPEKKIFAGLPGVIGVINKNLVDRTKIKDSQLELLRITPSSSFIGTTRVKPINNNEMESFLNCLEEHSIGTLLNIGGNGTIKQSQDIASKAERLKVISLPKTVDNDLGDMKCEHVLFTPGFPSCANYWKYRVALMDHENRGACSHDKVLITQTFGRETGFLAGTARLADPQRKLPLIILLPEEQRPISEVLGAIDKMIIKKGRCIVVMSEGYEIGDLGTMLDYSNQTMYGSSKSTAAQLLTTACNNEGIQARSFIPSVDQRLDISTALEFDLRWAEELGKMAVTSALMGKDRFLSTISGTPGEGISYYKEIQYSNITNFSRNLHNDFIDHGNFDVSDNYLEYLKSLLIGPSSARYNRDFDESSTLLYEEK